MDLEFTDDQEELRASVRSFLVKECPTELVRSVVETGEPAVELWRAMVALDWPALSIPEDNGGIGLSFVETAVIAEELGRVIAPGPLLATTTQFAPVIREVGTPEQRQRFLSGVATGAITGTLALADHPRRWGLADVTTLAERSGEDWTLRGTKHGVLADPGTDEVVVVARVGAGLGAFVVPGADAGLAPVHSLDASRPLFTATLDNVRVTVDRALGEPGSDASARGLELAVQEATLAMALETIGTSESLFQMVLAYVKDRQQFGVPIGSFQAVKHKMADMFVALERARALCYFAVAAIEEDASSRAAAAAMAKSASDDCQRLVVQDSFQSFGGIGFTWEHDSHLFIKRATTTGGLFGGTSIHTLNLAESLGWAPFADSGQAWDMRPGASLITSLNLSPHPEGGWFRRTWVAESVGDERPNGSAILYLLLEGEVSATHRIDATELWHFYAGGPLELRCERPDGTAEVHVMGPDVQSGHTPQVVVPPGVWQSARPLGTYALMGATVSPAFTFDGFELRGNGPPAG